MQAFLREALWNAASNRRFHFDYENTE